MGWSDLADEDIRQALNELIRRLADRHGPWLASQIGPILFDNQGRGRIAYFLKRHDAAELDDYGERVVHFYHKHHDYVHQLQVEKSAEVWSPLYEQLQSWAYNYLIRYGFPRGGKTIDRAVDCAGDAGARLVNSCYPFDTPFDAWACVLVRHVVYKSIDRSKRQLARESGRLVDLGEWLAKLESGDKLSLAEKIALTHDLQQALRQLPNPYRRVITARYLEGRSFDEIARETDHSVAAIYQQNYKAKAQLRKFLRSRGYR